MTHSDYPHSKDGEQLVLGLIIESKDAWTRASGKLTMDSFHDPAHRVLWSAIKETYTKRGDCNTVLLFETLGPDLGNAGGSGLIKEMTVRAQGKDLGSAIELVRDKQRARKAKRIGEGITKLASEEAPMDAIIAEAAKLREVEKSGKYKTTSDWGKEAAERTRRRVERGPDYTTGWRSVDDKVGGFYKGLTYIIGAWTSHGKTSVLANLAARNLRAKIYYNGFENPYDWLPKVAAIRDGIPLLNYTRPNQGDYAGATTAAESIERLTDEVKDTMVVDEGASFERMVSVCEEFRPDIIFLDYIQTFAGDRRSGKSEDNFVYVVGKAAEDLRRMAIRYDAVMVFASQLARPQDFNPEKLREPHIYQLKESGTQENVADAVFLLHWPWRDQAPGKPDGGAADKESQFYVITGKNRGGTIGKSGLRIDHRTLAISEWSEGPLTTGKSSGTVEVAPEILD